MKIVQIAIGKKYYEEAKVSIASIRRFYDGDIRLITDQTPTEEESKGVLRTVYLYIVQPCSPREASGLKLKSPDFFEDGDTILYLDTDIICTQTLNLPPVSHKIQVYGYPHRNQNESSFAGYIERRDEFNLHPGINTGVLYYQVNEKTRQLFQQAKQLYDSELEMNRTNDCWEQPALCHALITQNMYQMSLNPYVSEARYTSETKTLHHYCGLRNNRINPMKQL